jgi:hypothetical protein
MSKGKITSAELQGAWSGKRMVREYLIDIVTCNLCLTIIGTRKLEIYSTDLRPKKWF